jgi:hypothetical protein
MANRDAKLEKVLLKYGSDGYSLYWLCLELIADRIDSTHIDFELEHDAETLGYRLHIDTLRVEEIMRYFVSLELFENDQNRITCLKLAARLENSIVKSPELKIIQNRIKERKIPDDPGKSRIIPENSGQIRLDQIRLDSEKNKNFIIPTYNEVKEYCNERGNSIDAEQFIDYYTSKGWMIGKNKMKDWKAAIRTWERNNKDKQPKEIVPHEPIKCECGGYFNAGGFCTKCGKEIG